MIPKVIARVTFRRATHDQITGKYIMPESQGEVLKQMNYGIIHLLDSSRFMTFDEIVDAIASYNTCNSPCFNVLYDLIYPLGELIKIGAIEMREEKMDLGILNI